MANGIINLGSNKSNLEARINWSSTSNGSTLNSSNVYAELQIRRNDGYTTTGTWNGVLNIDGNIQEFSIHNSISSDWITLKSFSITKNHNDDGTSSCWISGWCNGPSGTSMSGATVEGSSTVALDKIARYLSITNFYIKNKTINSVVVYWSVSNQRSSTLYSLNGSEWIGSATYGESLDSNQLSGTFNIINLDPNTTYSLKIKCIRTDNGLITESSTINFTTYDIAKLTSVPNINIGESHKIEWTNPSTAITRLKLCQLNGSLITDFGNVTGTSKVITPVANTIYALTPNSNTYKARYIITTTLNNTSYTNYKDCIFNITNSNPTFTNYEYQDINTTTLALTGNNQILVKGYSNVQAIISISNKAIAKNNSTMKFYKLVVGNKNTNNIEYSSTNDVSLLVAAIDNKDIIVYATDSRGNSTSVLKTAIYKEYSPLIIKSFIATRSNNGASQEVFFKFNGIYWNESFGIVTNTIKSINYKYKKTNSTNWIDGETDITFTTNNNSFEGLISVKGDLGADGFNMVDSFDLQLIVNDELSSKTAITTLGAGTPAISIYKNNVAIGKRYNDTTDENLQVGGDLQVDGVLKTPIGDVIKSNDIEILTTYSSGSTSISSNKGSIILRPNGVTNATGQAYLDKNGRMYITTNYLYKNNGDSFVMGIKSLYDNSSGTAGTVTLSESAANYTYLEIFVLDEIGVYGEGFRVYSPNGKTVSLNCISRSSDSKTRLNTKTVSISGTSITITAYQVNFAPSGASYNSNELKIVKVIGYK